MIESAVGDFTESSFQYDQLPTSTSIRLVKILASSPLANVSRPQSDVHGPYGSDFRLIRCSCETFNLAEQRPDYHTLSYTWGYPLPSVIPQPDVIDDSLEYNEQNKLPVMINDKVIFVGKNLYHALRRLQNLAEDADSHNSDGSIVLPSDNLERRIAPYDKTPLIRAAEKGYCEYVRELLQEGADFNAKDRLGQTSLHYAAENGHMDIVQLLVKAGADHTITNSGELTPMQVASYVTQARGFDRSDICHYLADPWATEHQRDSEDKSLRFKGYFWIDAICINQRDVLEKNVQVALMRRIYEEAAGTIVWLGPADERTLLAKEAIALIYREASDWWLNMAMDLDDNRETSIDDPQISAKFDALNALLMRPWFRRIWIIQEVARAKEVHVLCGEHTFPWHVLVEYVFYNCSPTAMRLLKQTRRFEAVPHIKSLNDDIVTDQMMLFRMVMNEDSWERNCVQLRGRELGTEVLRLPGNTDLMLSNLLLLTMKFKASEPRDRVFALLGLCDQDPGVSVDYEQPIGELFTKVAFAFMEGSNGRIKAPPLLGLTVVEGSRIWREENSFLLPSWVPDFNMSSPIVVLKRPHYAASRDIRSEMGLGPQKNTLLLRGTRFDVVDLIEDRDADIEEQLSPLFKPKNIPDTAHDEVKYSLPMFCPRSFFGIALSLQSVYPGGGSRVEALWRTVTNDAVSESYDAVMDPHEVAKKSFTDFVVFLLEARARKDDVLRQMVLDLGSDEFSESLPSIEELALHPMDKRYHHISDTLPWHTIWPQWKYNIPFMFLSWDPLAVDHPDGGLFFNDSISKYYRWRRLFRTSNGFLGMGSRKVRSGDEVWIIAGAPTVFLLRPVGTHDALRPKKFELLGEAYVHGIMKGEAVKERADDVERIELV